MPTSWLTECRRRHSPAWFSSSANLAEAETVKGELLSLRRNGNTYEPHSSMVHDDLLMALALAAWRVSRYRKDLLQPPPRVYKRPA